MRSDAAVRKMESDVASSHDGPDLTLESGRQVGRLDIALQVRVVEAGGAARSYLSRNLSIDGVFVRSTHPLATGAHVTLEFVLPKVRVFKVAGEIVRQLGAHEVASPGEAGMAIQFRGMNKADADTLRTFLANHGVR